MVSGRHGLIPRVDAIVSMAGDAFFFGQTAWQRSAVPVMAIGGTNDSDSPYMWSTHPTYEYASSPRKVRVALEGAEHMIFTGPCEKIHVYLKFFSDEFCSDSSWDRDIRSQPGQTLHDRIPVVGTEAGSSRV